MGALSICASSTVLTILAKTVSSPTLVALISKMPVLFMVAPITLSPFCLVTGKDSPVIMDSSTDEAPSITSPSTGMISPALTITVSPTCRKDAFISISFPSCDSKCALSDCNFINFCKVWFAFPFTCSSKYFPMRMNVINITAVSKKA